MNTKIFLILKSIKTCIGKASNANSNGGTVVHQLRHIISDCSGYLVNLGRFHFKKGFFPLDNSIDLAYVNEGISQSPRHSRIYLSNYVFCAFCSGLNNIYRHSITAETVFIRGRYLNESYINRKDLFSEKGRHIGKVYGGVISPSFCHCFPGRCGHEERLEPALFLKTNVGIASLSKAKDMKYLHIGKKRHTFNKFVGKILRFTAGRSYENPVSSLYNLQSFFYRL